VLDSIDLKDQDLHFKNRILVEMYGDGPGYKTYNTMEDGHPFDTATYLDVHWHTKVLISSL